MAGNFQLAVHLFLQLTVILLVCRIVGRLLRFVGQTQVVSEMIAGVLLGPSLLGLLAPEWQNWLFPQGAQMRCSTPGGRWQSRWRVLLLPS